MRVLSGTNCDRGKYINTDNVLRFETTITRRDGEERCLVKALFVNGDTFDMEVHRADFEQLVGGDPLGRSGSPEGERRSLDGETGVPLERQFSEVVSYIALVIEAGAAHVAQKTDRRRKDE